MKLELFAILVCAFHKEAIELLAEILEQGRDFNAVEAAEYRKCLGRVAREMRGRRAFFAETDFPDMVNFDFYAAYFQQMHDWWAALEKNAQ